MVQISPRVQDDDIKNEEGRPIAGARLFQKYLLNRCQDDFQRDWIAREATAAAREDNTDRDLSNDEIVPYSDISYAAQKARRQRLGLIKFIGELFKQQMLTERVMHECMKKLLVDVEDPGAEEIEIESLCTHMLTVGSFLDTPKARLHMDVYFSRVRELSKNSELQWRLRFLLQVRFRLRVLRASI